MTINDDFFAIVYPAFILISGLLISILPALIASRRNKSFRRWWLFSSLLFAAASLVLIKVQAVYPLIYLLAILPVVSLLALLPESAYVKISFPAISFGERTIPELLRNLALFLVGLIIMLGIAASLYYNTLPEDEERYFATYKVLLLLASLGLASFIFIVSNRRILHILAALVLVLLLALPVLLQPPRAYMLLDIPGFFTRNDILLARAIPQLISNPVAGVFVLTGICSGCIAALILSNDKYAFAQRLVSFGSMATTKFVFNAPHIQFSENPFLSSKVFGCIVLFIALFRVCYSPNESWIFLWPIVYLCLVLPLFLLTLAGVIFSSVVVSMSISQEKTHLRCGCYCLWTSCQLGRRIHWLLCTGLWNSRDFVDVLWRGLWPPGTAIVD